MNIPARFECYLTRFLILLILLMTACESDLKLDINDSVPLLTVNSILKIDESVKMQITENHLLPKSNDNSSIVKNALVLLTENGTLTDSLIYKEYSYINQVSGAYLSLKNFKPLSEHSYQIKVIVPGFKDISSTTVIPPPVSILSVDTNSIYLKNGKNTYKVLECIIKFKDPIHSKNYYKLSIDRLGLSKICHSGPYNCTTELVRYNAFFFCPDKNAVYRRISPDTPGFMSLENGDEEIWFDEVFIADDGFNDKIYELKVFIRMDWFSDWADPPVGEKLTNRTAYIRLYSINEEYYKYSKSYFHQLYKRNDLFSEPVQVYSNILNGTGIFSGASVSIDTSIIIPVSYNPPFN